ncbi:MAG: hypothetical protein QF384_10085 [Alphaproteobacteria bacterium]|nr:hypothetical protein [Alphaproteobacteria bacterium]MDP6829798.1 hypothetical protein [Alphaproteobacteria bacterium]
MAQKSRWSVSGVEPECRVAAKVAARRAGLTIGEWLSRVIMESAKESIQGQELAPVKSELPSAPLNELTDAIESLSELIHKQNARAEKAAEKAAEEAAQRGRAEVEEPIEKAVTPVRENVRKLEEELETKLEALQKGGQDDAGPMQERVREAEAKAERPVWPWRPWSARSCACRNSWKCARRRPPRGGHGSGADCCRACSVTETIARIA